MMCCSCDTFYRLLINFYQVSAEPKSIPVCVATVYRGAIKEYQEDGLHSLNPKYAIMYFAGDESIPLPLL